MTEDDTFQKLKRIPFKEMGTLLRQSCDIDLMRKGHWHIKREALLRANGWSVVDFENHVDFLQSITEDPVSRNGHDYSACI